MINKNVSSGETLTAFLSSLSISITPIWLLAKPALVLEMPRIFVTFPIVLTTETLGAVGECATVRAFVSSFVFPGLVSI